jgi:hypothetical protein
MTAPDATITHVVTFLDPALFAPFDLPPTLTILRDELGSFARPGVDAQPPAVT